MLEFVTVRDHRLMRTVNRWSAPRWVRLWMVLASRGGDGWLWWGMGFAVLLFGGEDRIAAAASAGLAAAIGSVVFIGLKQLTGRQRPSHYEPHCWATLLPPDQFSFPSGHTIVAFAVCTPLMLFYPSMTAGLVFCAISVAASRILLGLHFLSDVIAGAIIGAAIGYAARVLFL